MGKKAQTVVITMTQPVAWREEWRKHMKDTGRRNFSEFVGDAVNDLMFRESKKLKKLRKITSDRPIQGPKKGKV